MNRPRSLDKLIIEVFRIHNDKELHWSQVRNELLMNDEIHSAMKNDDDKRRSFTVKLSRALARLCRDEILKKNKAGHRNATYKLRDEWRERLLKKEYSVVVKGSPLFAGLYTPGDTYEQVKAKALQQWIRHFYELIEPEGRKEYEELMRRRSKST